MFANSIRAAASAVSGRHVCTATTRVVGAAATRATAAASECSFTRHTSARRTAVSQSSLRWSSSSSTGESGGGSTTTATTAGSGDSSVADMPMAMVNKSSSTSMIELGRVQINGTTPRFYKKVGVQTLPGDDGYALTLNDRLVATPLKHAVVVPTEALALALALEWDAQGKFIQPANMPLMTLVTTAIDQSTDPEQRKTIIDTHARILTTDAALHRTDSPSLLVRLQNKHWQPAVEWLERDYQCPMVVAQDLVATPQPKMSRVRMLTLIESLNKWDLAAFDAVASLVKSVVVGWAVFKRQLNSKQAFEAARVDENFQMRSWGEVDGPFGHTVDVAYAKMKVRAVQTYIALLGPQHSDAFLLPRRQLRKAGLKPLVKVAQPASDGAGGAGDAK